MEDKKSTTLNIKQKFAEGTKLFAHSKTTEDNMGYLVPVEVTGVKNVRFITTDMYIVVYHVRTIVYYGKYGKFFEVEERNLYAETDLFLTQGV